MRTSPLQRIIVAGAVVALLGAAVPAFAQRAGSRGAGGPRAGAPIGRAVPRGAIRPNGPRGGGVAVRRSGPSRFSGAGRIYGPSRFYGARGFYYAAPFAFYGSALYGGLYFGGLGYGGLYPGYPWGFRSYWGPAYPYVPYAPYWGGAYNYYAPYPIAGPTAAVAPAQARGGVRLLVPQRSAEVTVDGAYVGIVDDFAGTPQALRLDAGRHRIELALDGYEPVSFDVDVEPGRTITYRTEMRPVEP